MAEPYVASQPVLATRVGVNDADCTVGAETYVAYTAITAPRTVTLGSGRIGQRLVVKDESGQCSSSQPIILNGTIDGDTSRRIEAAYGVIELYFNGVSWSEAA